MSKILYSIHARTCLILALYQPSTSTFQQSVIAERNQNSKNSQLAANNQSGHQDACQKRLVLQSDLEDVTSQIAILPVQIAMQKIDFQVLNQQTSAISTSVGTESPMGF